MIQTGLIQSAHSDLVTDASYDFYGLRLATCSLDQRIKIWNLDESNGTWSVEDDWKAHDAAVSKLSWAHPEFGSIIASSSFDRTVKVWERRISNAQSAAQQPNVNGGNAASTQSSSGPSNSRWIEMAMMPEAKGTVRAVEFAPHHFGLKLASVSSDNFIRIYECLDLKSWQLSEEIDVHHLPSASPSTLSHSHTMALATPTQTSATLEGASASLVAQALQQTQGLGPSGTQSRPGMGNREADGGWCVSWCKDRYWGEILAAGCGIGGTIKIIQISPSRRPTVIFTLDPSPLSTSTEGVSTGSDRDATADAPTPYAITSVAWAPSCGRSYHLVATGSRDGHVRIWRLRPGEEGEGEGGEETEGKWTGSVIADFDHHKSAVQRVEWNITGTVLSSAGNDGRVRLWKATIGNIWRPAGSIGVEQVEEQSETDVEMEEGATAD